MGSQERPFRVVTDIATIPCLSLAKYKLPAVYFADYFVASGGLVSYGLRISLTNIGKPGVTPGQHRNETHRHFRIAA